jgi:hypothetical protein
MAPDETTRAFVDMYARTDAQPIEGPLDDRALARLKETVEARPTTLVFAQWPGRELTPTLRRVARALGVGDDSSPRAGPRPAWPARADLAVVRVYALPNGRRYALLQRAG